MRRTRNIYMIKKRNLIAFILLFFVAMANAAEYSIAGVVVDEEEQPLPSAMVILYRGDKQYKGEATDYDGKFKLTSLEAGEYRMEVSFVGYKTRNINVILTEEKPTRTFRKIVIKENVSLLSSVEVSAKRSNLQVDIDKKTFLVNESAVSDGMSASEVLKEIPSVDVDVDGNVSMRNDENVEIYINGRPSGFTEDNRGELLEQLPAGSIEKVEVISNPSSKFSAEGSAGIINIVMKSGASKKASYYGSVSGGLSYPTGGRPGGNASATINFSKNKWSATFGAGYNNRKGIGEGKTRREYYGQDTTLMNQDNESESEMNSLFLRGGVSCQIDTVNSIGLTGMFSYGGRDRVQDLNYTRGYMLEGMKHYNSYQYRNSENDNDRLLGRVSLDYSHDFAPSHTLKAAVTMSTNKNDNDRIYIQENYDSLKTSLIDLDYTQSQNSLMRNRNLEIEVDYTNPLTQTSKLEAGAKASLSYQGNDLESFIRRHDDLEYSRQQVLDNDFELRQNIFSAYASYGNKIRRFSMQLGLRGELTDTDWELNTTGEESTSKPYFDLFPTAFFSYAFTKVDELQLSYTRRVSRPRLQRLNPYKSMEDSTNISYGNPDLDPEFTNSFELNYVKGFCEQRHTFIASIYYQLRQDIVQSYSWHSGDALMNTYANMAKSHSTGLELILKDNWKYVNLNTNFNLYYYKLQGGNFMVHSFEAGDDEIPVHIKGRSSFSWSAKVSSTFILPKNFTIELSGNYRSRKATAQGKTMGTYIVNLGAKKSLFDKRLNFTLSVRDLFDSRNRESETWSDDFYQYSESRYSGRTINFNVSYNFGNLKKSKKSKIGGGDDDLDIDDDF